MHSDPLAPIALVAGMQHVLTSQVCLLPSQQYVHVTCTVHDNHTILGCWSTVQELTAFKVIIPNKRIIQPAISTMLKQKTFI